MTSDVGKLIYVVLRIECDGCGGIVESMGAAQSREEADTVLVEAKSKAGGLPVCANWCVVEVTLPWAS